MKPLAKLGVVAAGYVAAFLFAALVMAVYTATTSGADRQGGMAAFGDAILFLGVFGVSSVPATGAALFFLRPYSRFWTTLSVAAFIAAATSIGAAATYAMPQAFDAHSTVYGLSPLRLLVAPLFAIFFVLSGVIAPNRAPRISLMVAGALEGAAFTYFAVLLVRSI